MSEDTRQSVCDWLAFSDDTQKSDLLNPVLTTTELIEFLVQLQPQRMPHSVLVTAVRSDHPTYDGPDGHSGGNAIDFVDNDGSPEHLVGAVQKCAQARGIGLGGSYQQYAETFGGYSAESKLFEDNASDHIHVQVVGY